MNLVASVVDLAYGNVNYTAVVAGTSHDNTADKRGAGRKRPLDSVRPAENLVSMQVWAL